MSIKDKYIYPAIFDFDEDGITVTFPDLPGCITCGDSQEEAFRNAKEVLELYMYGLEQDEEEIPEPSQINLIKTEDTQSICSGNRSSLFSSFYASDYRTRPLRYM